MSAPANSAAFDRAYEAPMTVWGDVRIPPEIKQMIRERAPRRTLELGCGLGRVSRWIAQQGVAATAVDFSPVAVEKARRRAEGDVHPPDYRVADVTRLDGIVGPFDLSFDVGCFHCLPEGPQAAYVEALAERLPPGAVHLVWTLDHGPSDLSYTAEAVAAAFAPRFSLTGSRPSRRRLVASRWSWLTRSR